jgi:hypothetical protein
MEMFALWQKDNDGRVFWWMGNHRFSANVSDAKRFATKGEAEVERWNVAGTDCQLAELIC